MVFADDEVIPEHDILADHVEVHASVHERSEAEDLVVEVDLGPDLLRAAIEQVLETRRQLFLGLCPAV